jgi:hypothetical protein
MFLVYVCVIKHIFFYNFHPEQTLKFQQSRETFRIVSNLNHLNGSDADSKAPSPATKDTLKCQILDDQV